jgi:hypothetical protein
VSKDEMNFKIALVDSAIPAYPLPDFATPPNVAKAVKVKDDYGEYNTYDMTEEFAGHCVATTAKIEYNEEGKVSKIKQVRYALLGTKSVTCMFLNRHGANEWITIYPMKPERRLQEIGKDENNKLIHSKSIEWVQLTEKDCK